MEINKNNTSKKALRQHVATTIGKNLLDLREAVGEKNFNRKVKKAAKILTSGLPKKVKALIPVEDRESGVVIQH